VEATGWRDLIHSDRGILSGKPVVKGTRLSVEFLLNLLANGWTEEQILESYPTLTRAGLNAVFAYAAESVADETVAAV
jgi:uncharacterized protein (DUF433 family)